MRAITLTRAEAVAVAWQLDLTRGDLCGIDAEAGTSEECWAAIRRLTLEATIRDSNDWWGHAPDGLTRPESFKLRAPAAAALHDLLPEIIESTRDDLANHEANPDWDVEGIEGARARLGALHGLAARLGVEIAAPLAPEAA
jgi:hypothetical protein